MTDRRTDELATAKCQRTDLFFDVGGLVLRGARYHARIGESGAQQGAHREHVQASADDRNGQRDAPRQIRTAVVGWCWFTSVTSRHMHVMHTCCAKRSGWHVQRSLNAFNMYSLEGEEQRAGEGDEEHGEVEDARVRRRHQIPIAVELIAAREHFPFPCDPRTWRHAPAQQIHLVQAGLVGWGEVVVCVAVALLVRT